MQRMVFADKNVMTLLILAAIAIFSLPLVLPHITHESMIYHIYLHLTAFMVSIFLVIVSALAYYRGRSRRLLFMMLALSMLTLAEFVNFITLTGNVPTLLLPIINVELAHMLILAMLVLFVTGVIKMG
ncbi:hypothetical protein HRbin04_01113 [archaeon HR04]|nr:hypothetical protein HRbin04_01113 [archaeon HR04]